jgi:predicted regulator of Ras-like GTPase activity (Roadblock/LC7/MglB family)
MSNRYPDLELSAGAKEFNWLMERFAADTSGVREAIAVSADGLPIAVFTSGDTAASDRLAAIVSGMTSLAGAAAGSFGLGLLNKVIIDMTGGYLLMSAISEGAVLGIVAGRGADLGTVAFEMTLFVNRSGAVLTPKLINELKNSV